MMTFPYGVIVQFLPFFKETVTNRLYGAATVVGFLQSGDRRAAKTRCCAGLARSCLRLFDGGNCRRRRGINRSRPAIARFAPDFCSTCAFAEHWTAYLNAKNLLNTEHKFFVGTFERVIQREFYGQTYQLGVRFDY
jgi:hypothetical protein